MSRTSENVDLDIVVKVFRHTVFSPFFAFFVPVTYKAQGLPWTSPIVRNSIIYFVTVTLLWLFDFSARLWRNGGKGLFRSQRLDWGEQIVLITGGASGIGSLLANTLAVRNVTVVVLDVVPFVSENDNVAFYQCDVSSPEAVQSVAKKIISEVGHPSIIINNAGVVQGKSLLNLSPEDVKQTLGVNVLGHFWILKEFLPEMIRRKEGHVVTVSSVMGLVGAAQLTDYSASKAALVGLHESLRYELDKIYKTPAIRTTILLSGHIHTPMFSTSRYAVGSYPSPLPPALFRFLAPSLQPHTIVKAIIAALDERESRQIMLPFFINFARYVALLPSWARDFMQWLSGADYVMEGFTKVTGLRNDEHLVSTASTPLQEKS